MCSFFLNKRSRNLDIFLFFVKITEIRRINTVLGQKRFLGMISEVFSFESDP